MPEGKMKALLVGDNTNSLNWGGRGATIALCQMLANRFETVGSLTNSAGNPHVGGARVRHGSIGNQPRANWRANLQRTQVYDHYIRLRNRFSHERFLAHDPAETVQNILRNKSRNPWLEDICEKVQKADLVIINGEGDIVFTTPPRSQALFLLGVAELGFYFKKKVAFVNSMLSGCPSTGCNSKTLEFLSNILSRCDVVTLRDCESIDFAARKMRELSTTLVPDSLFTWAPTIANSDSHLPGNGDFILPFPESRENFGKLDFSRPYICLGGSALAAKDPEKATLHFTHLLLKLRELGYPVYVVESCPGDSFLQSVAARTGAGFIPGNTAVLMGAAILANATLFVSGRYHPSIMASLGGTPCIFLQSSAHKMRSLQQLLEYQPIREFSALLSPAEVDEIVRLARAYLEQGESVRNVVRSVAAQRCNEALRLPDLLAGQFNAPKVSNELLVGCGN